jgi:thiamine biosynthesis lipoprotein
MNNNKLFSALFCIVILFAGCSKTDKDPSKLESKRKTSAQYFGTVSFAAVYDNFKDDRAAKRFEAAWAEITSMFADLEAAVSFDKPGSDIRAFNEARAGERVPVRSSTAEIITLAKKAYELTDGAFNPAVANLVDLWGFSPRFRNGTGQSMPYDRPRRDDGSFYRPDKKYIDAFRRLSDFSAVKLEGNEKEGYFLRKGAENEKINGTTYSLKIDLGGIAKGYVAQKASEILRAHGYEYGYVNLGFSSIGLLKRTVSDKGAAAPNMWAVSVSNPDDKTMEFLSVYGKDIGVSTSGTYDVRYRVGDREYSHIIDGNTGEPTSSDVLSATVLCPDAGMADALSTALCVMGRAGAEAFMAEHGEGYRIALVVREGDKGLKLITNISGDGYRLSEKGEEDKSAK